MNAYDFDPSRLETKLKEVKRKTASLSIFRLVVFVGMGALLVLGIAEHPLWMLAFIAVLTLFIFLISRYNFQKDQEKIFLALKEQGKREKLRRERNLESLDSGMEFMEKAHPFCNDLDLFGDHSLFQLINHTVSKGGKQRLAEAMKSGIDLKLASQIREGVDELAQKPYFLKSMEAVGMAFYEEEKESRDWESWLSQEEDQKVWLTFPAFVGPIGGIILSGLVWTGQLPAGFLGIWILLGMFFLGFVFQPLKKAGEKIPAQAKLKAYLNWLILLEREAFNSDFLQRNQAVFLMGQEKATQHFRELDRLGLWIQNRLNILYIPINLIFWTDLLLHRRFVSWKNKFGMAVSKYPSQLEKWEVLVSLGIFEVELGAKGEVLKLEYPGIKAQDLWHPLLHPQRAVSNTFEMGKDYRLVLLTGANMSGKTTFMRTLGINFVLINLGLRPFAKSFGIHQMQLYTSMRNSDNLGESVSSFYAELSRIKSLIDRLENGEPIFFLLDEILKGTNTEDRIAGSEALIRQLKETKALGIISTHDIEQASLEDEIPYVKNFSFHSEIHDQNIDFDYKIKPGPCPSFNAHKLMELMGIRFGGTA
ncbi:DNA mismatch repair protein [Algoriphagus sp. CAU 1675]|uniref:MutS-related protein n=1 Tax=Algoriphagus sp. CAU 1675 TaxID=3032597 RepID=UPI0023DCA198|nr:DNA mismatch repair protein [Algoriphagus sp. CAU 1675]MDF2156225.1 DNA mismatch repair protein [Algoriphagus sp. CAU 1675]